MNVNLGEYRNLVKDFYKRNADVFILGPRDVCFQYACTEWGEAIDAHIRSTRLGDLRNRQIESNFDIEVGDLKFMLMAATIESSREDIYVNWEVPEQKYKNDINNLMRLSAHFSNIWFYLYLEETMPEYDLKNGIEKLRWLGEKDEIFLAIEKLEKRCQKEREERKKKEQQ